MVMRTLILIAAFLTQFATIANAASWYIDPNATGTGAGTSWTNAWTTFSGGDHPVVWGASGVQAGDTVYISGGTTSKTYTSMLTVGASGSAGSPITIRPGQDAGHNGEVIFDFIALGSSGTGNAIRTNGRNYIVIDGRVGTERKLTIRNLYNTTNREGSISSAVSAEGNSNITVKFINIQNCNNGFYGTYGTGWDVNNCHMTEMRGNAAVAFVGGTVTNSFDVNLVHDNYIAISWGGDGSGGNGGPDGIETTDGTSIFNNTFRVDEVAYDTSSQHPDFVQQHGNYIKVYNNDFINIGDSAFDSDSRYGTDYYSWHDIWIYNNTFRILTQLDIYPEYIRFYDCFQTLTNVKILNNTFIDNPNNTTVYISCDNGATGSGIEIKNNIWYNAGLGSSTRALSLVGTGMAGAFDIDNNIYYGGAYIHYLGTTYTAANWLVAHEPNSSTSQPSFVSYSANNINNDLRLSASDTAAKDHGANLSAYFTTDKTGNTRIGAWDIGAYEYVSAATPKNRISLGTGSALRLGTGSNIIGLEE